MKYENRADERIDRPLFIGGLGAVIRDFAAHCARKAFNLIAIWHDRRMLAKELNALDDRILAELGLTRSEIPLMVRAYPTATEQFTRMLARIGLDTKEAPLDPATRGDMYRVCTLCAKRRRCRRWLASTKDADGYPAFCPNAWMFGRLLEARRRAHA